MPVAECCIIHSLEGSQKRQIVSMYWAAHTHAHEPQQEFQFQLPRRRIGRPLPHCCITAHTRAATIGRCNQTSRHLHSCTPGGRSPLQQCMPGTGHGEQPDLTAPDPAHADLRRCLRRNPRRWPPWWAGPRLGSSLVPRWRLVRCSCHPQLEGLLLSPVPVRHHRSRPSLRRCLQTCHVAAAELPQGCLCLRLASCRPWVNVG